MEIPNASTAVKTQLFVVIMLSDVTGSAAGAPPVTSDSHLGLSGVKITAEGFGEERNNESSSDFGGWRLVWKLSPRPVTGGVFLSHISPVNALGQLVLQD